MRSIGYIFWQGSGVWLGYLDDYPDYLTQGTTREDLGEHLADLHRDLKTGAVPGVRRHAMLEVV